MNAAVEKGILLRLTKELLYYSLLVTVKTLHLEINFLEEVV